MAVRNLQNRQDPVKYRQPSRLVTQFEGLATFGVLLHPGGGAFFIGSRPEGRPGVNCMTGWGCCQVRWVICYWSFVICPWSFVFANDQ